MASQHFDASRAIQGLANTSTDHRFDPALLIGHEAEIASAMHSVMTRYRDLVLRALLELDARSDGLALGALTASASRLGRAQRKALEETLTAVGKTLLPGLGELTQHRDPEVRRRSLNVLAKLGGTLPVNHLTTALADSNMQVRKSAMQSAALLARLHPSHAQTLAQAVGKHLTAKHWQERVAAAQALAQWPNHGKSEILRSVLLSDKKGFVRSAAARALATGQLRSPAVYSALAKASSHEQESLVPVRLAAVRALHALGGDKARAILRRVQASDPSEQVQSLARELK